MGSPLRASLRLLLYLSWTLLLIPVQALAVTMGWRLREALPLFYHRTCCRIFGIDVEVRGERATTRPVLFASNHTSYLDIMVLASLIPGSVVAKSEVANWPLFGLLAKLQRTVFVVRDRKQAAVQRDELTERLVAGDDLILFPEGTSNDGNRVLPFKSALFAVAHETIDGVPLTVQPVSVSYVALDGMPLGRFLRPFYAWYGDMEMATHIWRVASLGVLTVVVEFHPPAHHEAFASRKTLAEYCQKQVSAGVARALAGPGPAVAEPEGELAAAQ